MLKSVHPKLPMRNRQLTHDYYVHQLGFVSVGNPDYAHYLILAKDEVELHFFLYPDLNPTENYGMVYIRVEGIEAWYQTLIDKQVTIHPNAPLEVKPWGQKEFALLDPDFNLLTFGEEVPA
jgi:hypothetical protein